jgi:hypothetical protein
MTFEIPFEALEQGHGISRAARKARQDISSYKTPHFFGSVFYNLVL